MDVEFCLAQLSSCSELNESQLKESLKKCSTDIITIFGGWTNIIHLCLSNPIVNDRVTSESIERLGMILINSNKTRHQDTDTNSLQPQPAVKIDIVDNHMHESTDEPTVATPSDCDNSKADIDTNPKLIPLVSTSVSFNNHDHDDNKYGIDDHHAYVNNDKVYNINHDEDVFMGTRSIIANNIGEYYRSRIIVTTRRKDNIFGRLFAIDKHDEHDDQSKVNSNTVKINRLYDIISSNRYYYILCLIGAVSLLLLECYNFLSISVRESLGSLVWIFFSGGAVGFLVVLVAAISCILIINIKIGYLVTQTFDFWFKIYNFVCGMISFFVLKTGTGELDQNNLIGSIIVWSSGILLIMALFMMDALFISIRAKKVALGFTSVYSLYSAIFWYFAQKDYIYNPFGYSHTEISCKSVLLSSIVNLSIFVGKPMFSDVIRYCRRKLCHNASLDHSDHDKRNANNIERCYTIYKRPYIKLM